MAIVGYEWIIVLITFIFVFIFIIYVLRLLLRRRKEVMMIPCRYCGGLKPRTSGFCPSCKRYSSIEVWVCSSCGRENPPDNEYCGKCGRSLRDETKIY
jgi:ribosomal protein L40E